MNNPNHPLLLEKWPSICRAKGWTSEYDTNEAARVRWASSWGTLKGTLSFGEVVAANRWFSIVHQYFNMEPKLPEEELELRVWAIFEGVISRYYQITGEEGPTLKEPKPKAAAKAKAKPAAAAAASSSQSSALSSNATPEEVRQAAERAVAASNAQSLPLESETTKADTVGSKSSSNKELKNVGAKTLRKAFVLANSKTDMSLVAELAYGGQALSSEQADAIRSMKLGAQAVHDWYVKYGKDYAWLKIVQQTLGLMMDLVALDKMNYETVFTAARFKTMSTGCASEQAVHLPRLPRRVPMCGWDAALGHLSGQAHLGCRVR
jgi:hypothetical protein